jgi:hypothetical protein
MILAYQLLIRPTVDGTAAGKHEVFHAMPQRDLDQHVALDGVITKIQVRLLNGLCYVYIARHVDNGARANALDDITETIGVPDVPACKWPPLYRPVVSSL